MQSTIQKFRQSSIVFEKPGILSENPKTLTSSNYPTIQYFFAETWHTFSTYHCLQTRFYTLVFYTFINNSRSEQNLKNLTHRFVDITKKTCAKFQQKIIKSMVVGARQKFKFFRKPGFLEIIEVCLNLDIRFCIT